MAYRRRERRRLKISDAADGPVAWKPRIMMKGRKMEPSPSSTRGSLSFSSGAILSKSLAKNSSGSFAAVRGLRSLHASTARRRVDGVR